MVINPGGMATEMNGAYVEPLGVERAKAAQARAGRSGTGDASWETGRRERDDRPDADTELTSSTSRPITCRYWRGRGGAGVSR